MLWLLIFWEQSGLVASLDHNYQQRLVNTASESRCTGFETLHGENYYICLCLHVNVDRQKSLLIESVERRHIRQDARMRERQP